MSGQLNLAIIGLMLLTFMTIHLFQFRFADTEQCFLRLPPALINWCQVGGIRLTLFVFRRAPVDLFETNKKRNFDLYERRAFIADDSVDPQVVEFCVTSCSFEFCFFFFNRSARPRSLSHLLGVASPCVHMTLARAIEAWAGDPQR